MGEHPACVLGLDPRRPKVAWKGIIEPPEPATQRATLNAMSRPGTWLSSPLVSVTPELVHGLTQNLWTVDRKQGMHEDDVTTCQAALDHRADLVKVGVT